VSLLVIFITQWVYIYSHLHASFCDFSTRTQACIFAHASLKYITCSSSIYRYIEYRVVPIVIVADNTIIDEKVVYLVLFFCHFVQLAHMSSSLRHTLVLSIICVIWFLEENILSCMIIPLIIRCFHSCLIHFVRIEMSWTEGGKSSTYVKRMRNVDLDCMVFYVVQKIRWSFVPHMLAKQF
jgi:hypothetical protein